MFSCNASTMPSGFNIIIINLFNVDSNKNIKLVYIVNNSFWLN